MAKLTDAQSRIEPLIDQLDYAYLLLLWQKWHDYDTSSFQRGYWSGRFHEYLDQNAIDMEDFLRQRGGEVDVEIARLKKENDLA